MKTQQADFALPQGSIIGNFKTRNLKSRGWTEVSQVDTKFFLLNI